MTKDRQTSTGKDGNNAPITDEQRFEELFTLARLRKTWTQVRKELKQLELRDAIDCLDWAAQIEKSLPGIREEIISGRYQPLPPARYELGKTKGSFRFMTIPSLKDSLLYRHIADAALELATPRSIKGAYFSRRRAVNPVGPRAQPNEDPYDSLFNIWVRYNEYRTRTLLNTPYNILVTTDISNYFDSIEHDLLIEYLAPLGLPRKAVAGLGRLLEMLKPTAGHSPNPRVGLPVDELDCSRQLAHLFLFEHDQSVVRGLGPGGEDRYVRWMDDQNVGATSTTDARRIVNLVTRSLQKQRLTLNTGKTKFLTREEVIVEFHLDANKALSDWETRWKKKAFRPNREAAQELKGIWREAAKNEGEGHWDKVLKRFYAHAVSCNTRLLDGFAYKHIVEHPAIAPRVFLSLARRGRAKALLTMFERYIMDGESLFEATEAQFFDALLLANIGPTDERAGLDLVRRYLNGEIGSGSPGELGRAAATLAHYWLGGKTQDLESIVSKSGWRRVSPQVARAFLSTTVAMNQDRFQALTLKFVGHPSDDVGRAAEFLGAVLQGEIGKLSFSFAGLKRRWPQPGMHYDARAWLQMEIMSQSGDVTAASWLNSEVSRFARYTTTRQEMRILKRILSRGRIRLLP
jgi:hypothetical protein